MTPQFRKGNFSCDDSVFGKRQSELKVRTPLLSVTRVCLERPLGLSFAGSWSSNGVGGLGFFLGARPCFQSVQHLGRSGAVAASPRVTPVRRAFPGIPAGGNLRKWGIWSIPVCAEGEEPPGSLSQGEDERSKLLDLSFFLRHRIIITK